MEDADFARCREIDLRWIRAEGLCVYREVVHALPAHSIESDVFLSFTSTHQEIFNGRR